MASEIPRFMAGFRFAIFEKTFEIIVLEFSEKP
jgi:hypothetical protein